MNVYWGFKFAPNLKWDSCIRSIHKDARKTVNLFYRTRMCLTTSSMFYHYRNQMRPIIEYHVYAGAVKSSFSRVQNRLHVLAGGGVIYSLLYSNFLAASQVPRYSIVISTVNVQMYSMNSTGWDLYN